MQRLSRPASLLLALLTVLTAPLAAKDWPTYRHDSARSGATDEAFPGTAIKWRFTSPSPPRRAWSGPEGRTIEGKVLKDRIRFDDAFQPVVAGNRVFFGSSADHQLYCLNLESGQTEWTFFTGAPVRLAPSVDNDRVYFGSDDGHAYCLDASNGELVWKRFAGPLDEWILGRSEMISRWAVRTGVLVDNGIAYFGAGIFPHEDIYLYALDAETGAVIWQRDDISESDAGRNDLSPQGYLLASDKHLFVPSGRSMPATFNRHTGELLHKRTYSWRSTAGGVVGGTRALLADGQIYAGGAHHMLALEEDTGDVGFGWFDGRQMVVHNDDAYVATGSHIRKLNRQEYAVASRQRHKLEMDIYSMSRSLRSAKGDKADDLRAKIKTAREAMNDIGSTGITWQVEAEHDAALLLAGDTLLVGGEGQVIGLNAGTGESRFELKINGAARGLVVANGHLIVSTTTGEITAFGDGTSRNIAQTKSPSDASPYPDDATADLYRHAATSIVESTHIRKGYCLVVGSEDGRLAYELAKRTDLKIYGVEPDAEKVAASRRLLARTGLYGSRITIHHADIADIPYSNYFANLVVSDSYLLTGELPDESSHRILRHVKPLGGVVWLSPGVPDPRGRHLADAGNWLYEGGLADEATVDVSNLRAKLTRGPLPGAGNWSHQYGNVGNTAIINDTRVKGDLGVLWYGDPGPGDMVNRHEGAVGPLSVNGRLFVQGEATILAYDAYNGQFLWKYENKEALRTGVFQNQNPGNLAASDDRLFHFLKDECFEVDAATGEAVTIHRLPPHLDDGTREWGFVAHHNSILFGTATVREEVEARLRRRGRKVADSTDAIFAIDAQNGEHLWSYEGGSISHRTIAISDEDVFFIDSTISSEERERILREDKSELASLTGEARDIAEDRMKNLDARTAVSINARTGQRNWAKGVDVTDCSEIGIGGGKLTLMHHDGVLMLCGANANGHYWRQFIAGEFKRRRLVALDADTGYQMWKKDADYRHRPIIVGNRVIAEPWAFELKSGEQIMKTHPLTGQPIPWSMIRPGHHCGMLTGSDHMLMFRSGYTGFYNLANDEGTRHFAGHRLGCWINAIPANGLVMIPEASAGCVCQFSIASTIVLEPRPARRPWTIVSATGAKFPVRHMALNFGAPGDRRDESGTIWLAYPRPNPKKETGLDLAFDLKPKFDKGGFTSVSAASQPIADTNSPWLYTSWASGLTELTVPLRRPADGKSTYDLTLHLARIREGQTEFDIEVNGEVVHQNLQAHRDGENAPQPVIQTIRGIQIEESLKIRLLPQNSDGATILSALEIHESARETAKN